MKKLILVPLAGLLALPFLVSSPKSAPVARAAAETFAIDAGHSSVLFQIQHLGVANFWGRFNEFSGSFTLDSADPAKSAIEIEVATESVDTNSEGRDRHIKSDDFFAAKTHPTITFKSTKVKKKGANGFEVAGDLTFLGKTEPITLEAELVGRAELGGQMGTRAGLQTEFTIKRSDFGNTTYIDQGALGDEVRVVVSLEGVLQG